MVGDIDQLIERLEHDDETFSASEVRILLDWTRTRALTDTYNKERIASSLQLAQQSQERMEQSMRALYDAVLAEPTSPTLQVITYE